MRYILDTNRVTEGPGICRIGNGEEWRSEAYSLQDAAAIVAELEELRERAERAEAERDGFKERFKFAQADFETWHRQAKQWQAHAERTPLELAAPELAEAAEYAIGVFPSGDYDVWNNARRALRDALAKAGRA